MPVKILLCTETNSHRQKHYWKAKYLGVNFRRAGLARGWTQGDCSGLWSQTRANVCGPWRGPPPPGGPRVTSTLVPSTVCLLTHSPHWTGWARVTSICPARRGEEGEVSSLKFSLWSVRNLNMWPAAKNTTTDVHYSCLRLLPWPKLLLVWSQPKSFGRLCLPNFM